MRPATGASAEPDDGDEIEVRGGELLIVTGRQPNSDLWNVSAVGTLEYNETALGSGLKADAGYAKVIVGADGEILGCHIIGPHASMLIHEVSTAVAANADAERIAETIHVHPALSEVFQGRSGTSGM